MTHRRITPTALLLTAALHLALLLALLSPQPRASRPAQDGAAIQWLQPAPLLAKRPAAPPRQASEAEPARARRPQPSVSAPPELSRTPAQQPQAVEPSARMESAPDDPFAAGAQPGTVPAAQLLLKSGYGAGAVDRELRGGKAARLAAGGNALQAKIDEGFAAAVARKRWDPATIQEISTPSDRVRVYKMTTSSGTVCISIPDPSMEKTYKYTITNCPRENERGDVSPAVAGKTPRTQP